MVILYSVLFFRGYKLFLFLKKVYESKRKVREGGERKQEGGT